MSFEEFDNKIKEAAANHHPNYDEQAWVKMEKLLDKHMPLQKDNRRRYIFLLLFFLLLGGAAWVLISQPWKQGKDEIAKTEQTTTNDKVADGKDQAIISTKENPEQSTTTSSPGNTPATAAVPATNDVAASQKNILAGTTGNTTPAQEKSITEPALADKKSISRDIVDVRTFPFITGKKKNRQAKPVTADSKVVDDNDIVQVKTEPAITSNDILKEKEAKVISDEKRQADNNSTVIVTPPVPVNDNMAKTGEKKDKAVEAPVTSVETKQVAKKNNGSNKKTSNFFFTLSAGPDVSAAGTDKLGKLKLVGGVGVGYTFKERFTVRTGFYTARKVYSASPYQYHPPEAFWTYYPTLQQVKADCRVYEIPLLLSYNFGRSAKQNWFVSAGSSSYLMKRETYNYFYKNASTGQLQSHERTFNNENKHFFSVLTLSGGYQRQLNKTFSLTAEPYVKVPLSGVGYGKVKLNSAGILLSLGIHPFHQRTKSK